VEYEKFKLQNSSAGPKRAFMVFRILDEKIRLAEQGPEGASWQDFLGVLQHNAKDGAYGIFDFKCETKDGRKLQKLVFVAWSPEGLPVKQKMMYASAREPFKSQLGSGLAYVIQANDLSDLDEAAISDMVIKGR